MASNVNRLDDLLVRDTVCDDGVGSDFRLTGDKFLDGDNDGDDDDPDDANANDDEDDGAEVDPRDERAECDKDFGGLVSRVSSRSLSSAARPYRAFVVVLRCASPSGSISAEVVDLIGDNLLTANFILAVQSISLLSLQSLINIPFGDGDMMVL